jgi:FkbM family methyltransferase
MPWDPRPIVRAARGLQRRAATDRRLHELLADPVTGGVVEAETDVGPLLLHADDQVITPAIVQDGEWEADEGAWLRATVQPGHTVIDCGANIGYFSVLASRLAGPRGAVIAVEPDRDNLRLLTHNLWRNGCENVRVVPAAAWRERGVLSLRRSATNTGDHRTFAPDGEALVPSVTLDELLAGQRVDVVKIDTQGADHHVVAGLEGALRRDPACVTLIEFWLDGMQERDVDPRGVLAGYRALGRPLALLRGGGELVPADDDAILAAATGWEGRWVNLVLGARA